MSDATLESVVLGENVVWVDEFDWTPVGQHRELAFDGALITEYLSANSSGRPYTLLVEPVEKSVLDDLVDLRDDDPQVEMTYTDVGGTTHAVIWDHSGGRPIEAVPAVQYSEYEDADLFSVTLKLIGTA
jgi:hypothetical protein